MRRRRGRRRLAAGLGHRRFPPYRAAPEPAWTAISPTCLLHLLFGAEGANLAIWHGSGLDLGIFTAAQLHLAASAPNCTSPGDQAASWLREHMLIAESFEVKDGAILVPPGPGLGVTLDEDALAHYAVETWG